MVLEVLYCIKLTQRLEAVKESKVQSSINEDASAGNAKSSVQSSNSISSDSLVINIYNTTELPLPTRSLGINSQSCAGVVY